jgi:hypothetical protein
MNEKLLTEYTQKYISLLNAKDIDGLSDMYYSYSTLKDWSLECGNKESILELNKKMFSEGTLDFQILDIDIIGNVTYCIMWIWDGNTKIKVLDCIHWIDIYPDTPKIVHIRAFKLD